MTKMGQKFVLMLLILLGVAAVLIYARLAIGIFVPSLYTLPLLWLPEDLFDGLLYEGSLELVNTIPALGVTALLLTYSFWLRPEELPVGSARGIPASQALVRFSVLSIAAAGVLALLVLFAQPWLQAKTDEIRFRQVQAGQLEDAYLELKKAGLTYSDPLDLEARLSLIQRLGTLRPEQNAYAGNERFQYDFELQIIKTHIDMDEFFRLRLLPGVEKAFAENEATVEDLLRNAETALASRTSDAEFQANLYAYAAFRRMMVALDRGQTVPAEQLSLAKQIVDESWIRIRERTLLVDERLKASYFFRKGKSLGDYNFQNYLEAYYGFQELHAEDPNDAEVTRYWELSLAAVRGTVFFRQELDVLFRVPGSENLVFLNRVAPREVVKIGKLLDTSQGVYVKDLEFFRFSATGEPLLHWRAPYGEWTDKGISFRIWEKDKAVPDFPQVFVETPDNPYDRANSEVASGSSDLAMPPVFVPSLSVRDLQVISSHDPGPQTLGTWALLTQGQSIAALGYSALPLQTEFVARLLAPFGYFVLFLFVFAIAWHFRALGAGRSWWLLFPLLPLVAQFGLEFLVWWTRLIIGGAITNLSLPWAFATLGTALLVAAVVGLLAAYRQLNDAQPD
ncbi:MAG: hypothetical protein WCG80_13705 [Spirochaetales bacterium]